MAQATAKKPLDPMQQQIFITCANLFLGKEEGTASGLVFFHEEGSENPADGLSQWKKVVKIKTFPANREAKIVTKPAIVQDFTNTLIESIDERNLKSKVSFVEIGPGLWDSVQMKTLPYIDALKDSQHPVSRYISVDPSKECAVDAANGIKKKYPDIASRSLVDMFEKANYPENNTIPVALLWGLTIWNSSITPNTDPELVLANQIKAVGKFIKPGGYILSTYCSSETKEMDEKAYNTPENLQLIHSLAHRFEQNITDTNFEAKTFEPYVEYRGNGIGRFCMGIKSKIDQTIRLNGSVEKHFEKGDGIVLTNSWRLTEAKLYKMVNSAGAEMIKHTYDKETGAGMFLAQFK
ncbi:MAG: L-histidine N(alpha)-methyltransferase [Alphaproteobacteria bacterium]|nr:L-histidine N(alpha)-methyltransferase [Alphaproteobacteria bacterium]